LLIQKFYPVFALPSAQGTYLLFGYIVKARHFSLNHVLSCFLPKSDPFLFGQTNLKRAPGEWLVLPSLVRPWHRHPICYRGR